jgi:hypothetical protein
MLIIFLLETPDGRGQLEYLSIDGRNDTETEPA